MFIERIQRLHASFVQQVYAYSTTDVRYMHHPSMYFIRVVNEDRESHHEQISYMLMILSRDHGRRHATRMATHKHGLSRVRHSLPLTFRRSGPQTSSEYVKAQRV